jgi:hypothetical protein
MKRDRLGPVLALVLACSALAGCELMHHEKRPTPVEPAGEEGEASSVDAVESKPPPGFFSPTRMSGAWSSEARSIERNLGVP